VIYLVYRMKLSPQAQHDLKGFWAWLENRESWFYRDLQMVRGVRWYLSVVGELYTLECWAAFDDETAYGAYRQALAGLKRDSTWEGQRVSQGDWWEFLDSRLMEDPPCSAGFGEMPPARRA